MIDPFSCLSIATATAQFIDFGVKVLNTACDIQRTKSAPKVIRDFEDDLSRFKDLSTSITDARGKEQATTRKDGHAITDVAKRCEDLADDILTMLEKIKVRKRSGTLRTALRVHLKSSEIEEQKRLLLAAKVDLCTHLAKALDSKQSSLVELFEALRVQDRAMETNISKRLDETKAELEQLHLRDQACSEDNISNLIERFEIDVRHASKLQYMLSTFSFDTIHAREEEIKEKHSQTFRWVFTNESEFSRWLRTESSLFWVSGKAGSGKSTFMKYVSESPETRRQLKFWAGEVKLLLSRHFFWNPGTPLQKSYRGLLQSLCYDIFRSYPELLPYVCKEAWSSLTGVEFIRLAYQTKVIAWREADMVNLIRKVGDLRPHRDSRHVRICFFIDGLDEYHGEHDQLVEAITMLSTFHNVKIVVSSRPWNIFVEAFGEFSKSGRLLILQDLTRCCIAAYVRDRLEHNRGFQRLMQTDPRCSDLVSEIATKADGVFLWVFLVMNELSKSLVNRDDIATLQRRLKRIPPGLEPYFQYMFDNLDEFYRFETTAILRAVLASVYPLPILGLSVIFATEPLAAKLLEDFGVGLDGDEITQLEANLQPRLVGCCGDLLEVRDGKIQFLHLTVREFLATDIMAEELARRSAKDFDLDIILSKTLLVAFRYSAVTKERLRLAESGQELSGYVQRGYPPSIGPPRELGESLGRSRSVSPFLSPLPLPATLPPSPSPYMRLKRSPSPSAKIASAPNRRKRLRRTEVVEKQGLYLSNQTLDRANGCTDSVPPSRTCSPEPEDSLTTISAASSSHFGEINQSIGSHPNVYGDADFNSHSTEAPGTPKSISYDLSSDNKGLSLKKDPESWGEDTEYLYAFYTHARAFEDRHGRSATEVHQNLKQIASASIDLTGLQLDPGFELELLLVWMSVSIEFENSLLATGSINSRARVTEYALEALKYLLLPEPNTFSESRAFWKWHLVLARSLNTDPDRRGFRLEIIQSLLEKGADAVRVWDVALDKLPFAELKPGFRKTKVFDLLSELKKAGASCSDKDQEVLESIFGSADARWLRALITGPGQTQERGGPRVERDVSLDKWATSDVRSLSSLRLNPRQILTSTFSWFGS